MSTYHLLLKRPAGEYPAFAGAPPHERDAVEIGIDERGGAYDLHVRSPEADYEVTSDLTCADLRKIRDRINEVLLSIDEDKDPS